MTGKLAIGDFPFCIFFMSVETEIERLQAQVANTATEVWISSF